MSALIDTNVAIHLRDRDLEILDRFAGLTEPPSISIVTRVELLGGIVAASPEIRARRSETLEALLAELRVLDFDEAAAAAYGRLLAETGYSRTRILDRMIAATALAHGLTLITINGQHFRDIPGLDLVEWSSPAINPESPPPAPPLPSMP